MCVFAHSRFVENPPIWSWEKNPSFLRRFYQTFPILHRHCRVAPPSPPATKALSPPMNAIVPRLLHRLHTTPTFGWAPPPTSLPDALTVAPMSSPTAPCRRPATTEPLPRLDRAARPRSSQLEGRLRMAGHHALWAIALGWIGPDTVRRLKICFLIYLIPEILANF
jgi:hypothetical protein